jgi:hypothetical protein
MGLPESRKWLDVEPLTNFFGGFGALDHKGAPGGKSSGASPFNGKRAPLRSAQGWSPT